jgi:putative transposase
VSTFAFIEAEKAHFPISFMCSRLGVSRAGFYAWRARRPSRRDRADARLLSLVRAVHASSRGTYGAPRVHAELRAVHAVRCGRKRVARLMHTAGLVGVHRRRRIGLTRRDPAATPSPDLVKRNFAPHAPNRLWVADITQQRTGQGWFYLAVIVDAYSRRVVGWAMAEHVRTDLVLDALSMAIAARRPPPGLVHHSDQGAQYTSLAFGRALCAAGIAGSMGTVGDCYDNAMAESFFATLQTELLDRHYWTTRRQLATAVFDYIETFYNRRRRHSALGYHSPADYERITTAAPAAA